MKKSILFLSLLFLSVASFSQKCEERESKLLVSLGSLSATLVYNTYIGIGSISDGYANEVYSAEKAIEIMDEQITLLKNVKDEMAKLIKEKALVSDDDVLYVKEVIVILDGLATQASYAKKYAQTGAENDSSLFQKARETNWANISKLIGLDEE